VGGDCDAGGSSAGRDGDSSSGRASKRQHLMADTAPAGPSASSADAGAAVGQLQLPAKMAAAAQRGLVLPAPYRVNHPGVQYAAPDSPHSRWLPRPGGHRTAPVLRASTGMLLRGMCWRYAVQQQAQCCRQSACHHQLTTQQQQGQGQDCRRQRQGRERQGRQHQEQQQAAAAARVPV
jgi:hypothetical protein